MLHQGDSRFKTGFSDLDDSTKTRRQMDSVVFRCRQLRMLPIHALVQVSGPSKGGKSLSNT
jgi:hypothetical protein